MSKQCIKPSDGRPSNKHGVFAYFLAEPEEFDAELAHEKYPSVDLGTIVSWESVWRNWNKNTFTGTDGFPRGMADTAEQIALIKSAIQRARSARGTGRRTTVNRIKVSPDENFAGELHRSKNLLKEPFRKY